jgi:hypothetical protein
MKSVIRFYTPDDIDELVHFWNENGGWDIIDRTEWEKRFYNTPNGPCSIVIALDESKKIVGQFIFIPTKVLIGNEIYDSFRPHAPMIRKDVRSDLGMLTLFEYISKMYKFAVKNFIKQKTYIIFMLPYRRWARAFKFIKGTMVDSFPLWSFSMQDPETFILPPEYSVENIKADDERINDLWEKSRNLFKCCAVRDASVLSWKLSLKKFFVIGILNNGRLAGLCACLYSEPDKQWLLNDILAEDEETLEIVIKAACNEAGLFKLSLKDSGDTVRKVAILVTPLIEKVVSRLSFYKDNYDFSVVIHILNSKFKKKELAPQRWYFSAND